MEQTVSHKARKKNNNKQTTHSNNRRIDKEELQQRNRIGMASRQNELLMLKTWAQLFKANDIVS